MSDEQKKLGIRTYSPSPRQKAILLDETPFEFLLHTTGKSFDALTQVTWEDVDRNKPSAIMMAKMIRNCTVVPLLAIPEDYTLIKDEALPLDEEQA